MKKYLLSLILCTGIGIGAEARMPIYDLDFDDSITAVSSPTFTGSVGYSTFTPVGIPSVGTGWTYLKPADNHLYFQNELGIEFDLTTGTGGGGGTNLITKEDSVIKSSSTLSLNFIDLFTLTENPAQQINVAIDSTTLLSDYITSSEIDAIYLTQTDASSTYLQQSSATLTYLTQSSATLTYLTQSSATLTYWQPHGWEQFFSESGGIITIATNTTVQGDVVAVSFFGDGSGLTGLGIVEDHNLLTNLQGGSAGGVTNSNNIPFTNSINYTFTPSEIEVTGGIVKLKSAGVTVSHDWPFTTASSYTFNTASITVIGGAASLKSSNIIVPLIQYHFNESTGSTASDSSGNGNDGVLINMEDADWQPGILNNSLNFDGADEYVSVPGTHSSFKTVELWVNPGVRSGFDFYFGHNDWRIYADSANGVLYFGSATGSISSGVDMDGLGWTHIITTNDGTTAKIYVNGVLKNSGVLGPVNSAVINIGRWTGAVHYAIGKIDEVVVYNIVLSTNQITARYNSGAGTEALPTGDPVYSTGDPIIATNNGFVFNSSLTTFVETVIKPINTDIKYQLSSDNGGSYKYFTTGIWIASDGSFIQSNSAEEINTNISTLALSGTLKIQSVLRSTDAVSTPQLDLITVGSGVTYSTGAFTIEMKNDIQPTINNGYQLVAETSIKPVTTDLKYQFSIDGGLGYNGSWLSSATLQTQLQAVVTIGDGSDKLRLKFQLITSTTTDTPELDNINITSDGGSGGTEMFHLSSGTYADITGANAQLTELQTTGSPQFSTVTVTAILGNGEFLENIGRSKATKLTSLAVVSEGAGIQKGQVVYFNGASGGIPTVGLADRLGTGNQTVPIGVAAETKTNTQEILIRLSGSIADIDTALLTPGDILYLDTLGNYVDVVPSSGVVKIIGAVTYGAASGSIGIALLDSSIRASEISTNIIQRLGDGVGTTKLSIQTFTGVEIASITSQGDAYFNSVNSVSTVTANYFIGDGGGLTNVDAETLDGFDSTYFTPIVLFNNEISALTTTYITLSSAAATYMQTDIYDSTGNGVVDDSTLWNTFSLSSDTINALDLLYWDGADVLGKSTTTLQGEIDTRNISIYAIVIATHSGPGITFNANAVSTFTAQIAFQAAWDLAQPGDTIFVRGGTYVINSSMTCIGTDDVTWLTDSAIIQVDANASEVNDNNVTTIFVVASAADRITFDGFKFDMNSKPWTSFQIFGDYWAIRNVIVRNGSTGGSNNKGFYIRAGADFGVADNFAMYDCSYNGDTIDNAGNQCRWINVRLENCSDMALSGTENVFSGLIIDGNSRVEIANDRNVFNGFVIMNNTSSGQMMITFSGAENNTIGNGLFFNSTITTALYLNGNNTTVSNITFWNIGTSNLGTVNALVVDSDNNAITNNTFRGTIDDYCIDLFAGELNNTVSNNTAFGLTNNTGFVEDNSGNSTNQLNGNLTDDPTYANSIVHSTTFYADLTVNGTFYNQLSYIHSFARDVTVTVTGSTNTFVILAPTWQNTVPHSGFTISGASITYTGKGGTPKVFKITGAFSAESDTVNTVTYWSIFKNGEMYDASVIDRKISTSGDVGALSLTTLIELEAGDILDIRLAGNNSAIITNRFVALDIIQIN